LSSADSCHERVFRRRVLFSSIVSCVRTTLDLIPTFFGPNRVSDWREFISSNFSLRTCGSHCTFYARDAPRRPSKHRNSAVAALVKRISNTYCLYYSLSQMTEICNATNVSASTCRVACSGSTIFGSVFDSTLTRIRSDPFVVDPFSFTTADIVLKMLACIHSSSMFSVPFLVFWKNRTRQRGGYAFCGILMRACRRAVCLRMP